MNKLLKYSFIRVLITTLFLSITGFVLEKYNLRPIICFIATSIVFLLILLFYCYCYELESEQE